MVTCPRPPVSARPNRLVTSSATQARACILSDHNIFYIPRGGENGGVMPLGLFLLIYIHNYYSICYTLTIKGPLPWASRPLHTVKFELTNQHSVGGKNCGVLTSRRFCALRFDFCVISEVYTVEVRFYFSVFFKFTACLNSVY